ncbi:MAG: hypothetical protein HQK49_14270 [Oligoflexia bacterium]|nr:hypothetical protein [Oligoflexia bacterium]
MRSILQLHCFFLSIFITITMPYFAQTYASDHKQLIKQDSYNKKIEQEIKDIVKKQMRPWISSRYAYIHNQADVKKFDVEVVIDKENHTNSKLDYRDSWIKSANLPKMKSGIAVIDDAINKKINKINNSIDDLTEYKKRIYKIHIPQRFFSQLENMDMLSAYLGVMALAPFKNPLDHNVSASYLINPTFVEKHAEDMIDSGLNPLQYSKLLKLIAEYRGQNEDLTIVKNQNSNNLLNPEDEKIFTPLPDKIATSKYITSVLRSKLSNEIDDVNVIYSADDKIFSSSYDPIKKIFNIQIPLETKKMQALLPTENDLLALAVASIKWQQWLKDSLGPDQAIKNDVEIVDTLIAKKINPGKYHSILEKLNPSRKGALTIEGTIDDVKNLMAKNKIDYGTRMTSLEAYLSNKELKYRDIYNTANDIPLTAKASTAPVKKKFQRMIANKERSNALVTDDNFKEFLEMQKIREENEKEKLTKVKLQEVKPVSVSVPVKVITEADQIYDLLKVLDQTDVSDSAKIENIYLQLNQKGGLLDRSSPREKDLFITKEMCNLYNKNFKKLIHGSLLESEDNMFKSFSFNEKIFIGKEKTKDKTKDKKCILNKSWPKDFVDFFKEIQVANSKAFRWFNINKLQDSREVDLYLKNLSYESLDQLADDLNFVKTDIAPSFLNKIVATMFSTIPTSEFSVDKVEAFIKKIGRDNAAADSSMVQLLAMTDEDDFTTLEKIHSHFNATTNSTLISNDFAKKLSDNFLKMIRGSALQNNQSIITYDFYPSKMKASVNITKKTWDNEIYKILKDEEKIPQNILLEWINKNSFFNSLNENETLIKTLIDKKRIKELIVKRKYKNLNEIAESLPLNGSQATNYLARKAILSLSKEEFSWDKVTAFKDRFYETSTLVVEVMTRLLAETSEKELETLANIHKFFANHKGNNIPISTRGKKTLANNFFKMIKGSVQFDSNNLNLDFMPTDLNETKKFFNGSNRIDLNKSIYDVVKDLPIKNKSSIIAGWIKRHDLSDLAKDFGEKKTMLSSLGELAQNIVQSDIKEKDKITTYIAKKQLFTIAGAEFTDSNVLEFIKIVKPILGERHQIITIAMLRLLENVNDVETLSKIHNYLAQVKGDVLTSHRACNILRENVVKLIVSSVKHDYNNLKLDFNPMEIKMLDKESYTSCSKTNVAERVYVGIRDLNIPKDIMISWIEKNKLSDFVKGLSEKGKYQTLESIANQLPKNTTDNYDYASQKFVYNLPDSAFSEEKVDSFVRSMGANSPASIMARLRLLDVTPATATTNSATLAKIHLDLIRDADKKLSYNKGYDLLRDNYKKLMKASLTYDANNMRRIFQKDFFSEDYNKELLGVAQDPKVHVPTEIISKWLSDKDKKLINIFVSKLKNQKLNDLLKDLAAFDNNEQLMKKRIFAVDKSEFTKEKVDSFITGVVEIKGNYQAPLLAQIRLLEYTRSDDNEVLAQIHQYLDVVKNVVKKSTNENIKIFSKRGCNILKENYKKMLRGSFASNPQNLFLEFTPAQTNCDDSNWVEEIYKIAKESKVPGELILKWVDDGVRERASLFSKDFITKVGLEQSRDRSIATKVLTEWLSEHLHLHIDEEMSEKLLVNNFVSYHKDQKLQDIANDIKDVSKINIQFIKKRIFAVDKKEFTKDKVASFVEIFNENGQSYMLAQIRLLENTDVKDGETLSQIHQYLNANAMEIVSTRGRDVLTSNFKKMLKGSLAHNPQNLFLKVTPSDTNGDNKNWTESIYEIAKEEPKISGEMLLEWISSGDSKFFTNEFIVKVINELPASSFAVDKVTSFVNSLKETSNDRVAQYLIVKALEHNDDNDSLATLHQLMYSNVIDEKAVDNITSQPATCKVFANNFKKMIKGSIIHNPKNLLLSLKYKNHWKKDCRAKITENFDTIYKMAMEQNIPREIMLEWISQNGVAHKFMENFLSHNKKVSNLEEIAKTSGISSNNSLIKIINSLPASEFTLSKVLNFINSISSNKKITFPNYTAQYLLTKLISFTDKVEDLAEIHKRLDRMIPNVAELKKIRENFPEVSELLKENYIKMLKGSVAFKPENVVMYNIRPLPDDTFMGIGHDDQWWNDSAYKKINKDPKNPKGHPIKSFDDFVLIRDKISKEMNADEFDVKIAKTSYYNTFFKHFAKSEVTQKKVAEVDNILSADDRREIFENIKHNKKLKSLMITDHTDPVSTLTYLVNNVNSGRYDNLALIKKYLMLQNFNSFDDWLDLFSKVKASRSKNAKLYLGPKTFDKKLIDHIFNSVVDMDAESAYKMVAFIKDNFDYVDVDHALLSVANIVNENSPEGKKLLSLMYKEITKSGSINGISHSKFFSKNFQKMLYSAMDIDPQYVIKNFPINIIKNLSEFRDNKGKAFDRVLSNIKKNATDWPEGMAWAFVNIHLKADNNVIDEIMLDIGSRRNILSFQKIPEEIKSAQSYDKDFTFGASMQRALLEKIPRETYTFDNLKSYIAIDDVWSKQKFNDSIIKGENQSTGTTYFKEQLIKRGDKKLLEIYNKAEGVIQENPILIYDLENSEKMQHLFVDKMKESKTWPASDTNDNLVKQHEILISLAKRGPSEFTDDELYKLYMNEKFTCASCIVDAVKNKAFWDLHRRVDIFEKYLKLTGYDINDKKNVPLLPDYFATSVISEINIFFPEVSLERSNLLEKLANFIKSDEELTKMIDSEKNRGINKENMVMGMYLVNNMLNLYDKAEERLALVKFLIKNVPLPYDIASRVKSQIGENRLRRQFLQLPPYAKALTVNALISKNVITNNKYRKELEDMIWSNFSNKDHQKVANLFYSSFIKALAERSPFQEKMFVSFLLGQLANSGNSSNSANSTGGNDDQHPGLKIKHILESLGGTGASAGQKIYQRRMLDADYLEYLKDMTDHTPLPSRHAIYTRLKSLLNVDKVDDHMVVQEILGGASTALVVKVKLKNGEERALKMTFEDLKNRTELEKEKMDTALEYIVQDGGKKYARFYPVVREVYEGLKDQEDLEKETSLTTIMKGLYEKANEGENVNNDFKFNVVNLFVEDKKNNSNLSNSFHSSSPEHVTMNLAKGKTLTRLSKEEQEKIFPVVFEKEMSILLANPKNLNEKNYKKNHDGVIIFEKDRHQGNFMADFSKKPVEIYVYDYPLLSSIKSSERDSLFALIGLLEGRKIFAKDFLKRAALPIIDYKIAELVANELLTNKIAPKKLFSKISSVLAKNKSDSTTENIFSIFSVIDELEIDNLKVKGPLIPYVIALGHAERYSQYSGENAFNNRIEEQVWNVLEKKGLLKGTGISRKPKGMVKTMAKTMLKSNIKENTEVEKVSLLGANTSDCSIKDKNTLVANMDEIEIFTSSNE